MIRSLRARNNAAGSENKIHDDSVARSYGFGGGLVPGRDVYAYITHLPVARWGATWLERGTIEVVLRRPVYDGDLVTITGVDEADAMTIELHSSDGALCATARAALPTAAGSPGSDIEGEPATTMRPAASPESLAVGTIFVPWFEVFDAAAGDRYLGEVEETLPLYAEQGVAHPGWLLRHANLVLMNHVVLGPWIHASSKVRNFGLVREGNLVTTRARVTDEFERGGHRFVVLDVVSSVDGSIVTRVEHTAIYEPAARRG